MVSGEGGLPFGLERYSKAFFVAWSFQHRVALGSPQATLRDLAAQAGITGRFAEHVWSVVNQPALGYPSSETVARWQALPEGFWQFLTVGAGGYIGGRSLEKVADAVKAPRRAGFPFIRGSDRKG